MNRHPVKIYFTQINSFLNMTLYEADLDKIAVPVKSVERKRKLKEPKAEVESKPVKEKKPRAKKVKVEEKIDPVEKSVSSVTLVEEKVDKPAVEEKVETKVEEKVETKVEKIEAPAEPVKVKKPRAPRQKKDPSIPPHWFAKYVEGVKNEQASLKPEKVAKKQIKEEAMETASKSWNNGLTRNRVQNEVDSHMSRMYSMIFSK
jgi:hypothetical protein